MARKEKVIYNITLQSDEDDLLKVIDSSSMNELSRKRRWCGRLCACCDRSGSEEDLDDNQPKTCGQKFCSCCCLPFRKLCNPFKRRRREDGGKADQDKPSFWEKICCCSSCCRKKKDGKKDTKKAKGAKSTDQGCFRSCLSRMNCFKCCKPCCGRMSDCCCGCCKKKKTPSTTALQKKDQRKLEDEEKPGCCKRIFCCCCVKSGGTKKPPPPMQRRGDSIVSDPKKKRMFSKIFCCCMKKDEDSRRTSMLSKKQSLAPTIPPPEDNKPKLDMTLVEHASVMKGAIPVLPIFLAWWCLIFNTFLPGTGTIFSGFFCLCLGIPRFSQHDRIRARIGAFVINCIVGVSQAFTIIFCLVGWGWSIWWGTTMLNLARKHKKMKDAEMNNNEQADVGTISTKSSQPPRKQQSSKDRDVEAGKK